VSSNNPIPADPNLTLAQKHTAAAVLCAARIQELLTDIIRRGDKFPEKDELMDKADETFGELVVVAWWLGGVTLEGKEVGDARTAV